MARKQKPQQDETRYCENCGISYIWAVEEQRIREQANSIASPEEDQTEDQIEVASTRCDSVKSELLQDSAQLDPQVMRTTSMPTAVPPIYCPGCRHLLPAEDRERGFVKWYNRRKGYGFIVRQDSPEIYVNRSAIRRGHLRPNDFVEFTVDRNRQGPIAIKVTILKTESS